MLSEINKKKKKTLLLKTEQKKNCNRKKVESHVLPYTISVDFSLFNLMNNA